MFTALLLAALCFSCSLSAREYIVDASWPKADGDGTAQAPLQTIQAAADLVEPGDIVRVRPGVYFEIVRLRRFGTADQPIVFRGEQRGTERAIITGADPAIRRGEVRWEAVPGTPGLYSVPYEKPHPSRMLYSGTDLFPYKSLQGLKTFTANPDNPGPKHGYFLEDSEKRLYVRLRPDGKYGPTDPNQHVIAVSPAPLNIFGPEYSLNDSLKSLAINFGLYGAAGQALHELIDNFVFETPGRTALRVSGNKVEVRNCLFSGCWAGGVAGRHFKPQTDYRNSSNEITLSFCEWHNFPVWDDALELIAEFRDAEGNLPKERNLHWWVHKSGDKSGVRAANYETGICSIVGENWHVRNCYIHDCFEAFAPGAWSNKMHFYDNYFARCIDNAIQTEGHAREMYIYRNRFEDVFQSISWQPMSGLPWPGPIFVYQNLFYWSEQGLHAWRGINTATLKMGAPFVQWSNPDITNLADIKREYLQIPGVGFLFYNNTLITPQSAVIAELNGTKQKLDRVIVANNLIIASRPRSMRVQPMSDGGSFFYQYHNNLCYWTDPEPGIQPSAFLSNPAAKPEAVLPDWQKYGWRPATPTPTVPVEGAPVQFKIVGAWQSDSDNFTPPTGPQTP